MKLYLIQHGISLSEKEDPQKPLTPEGIGQTEKVAEFLKRNNITVESLWHSNKLRAIQTAQIISQNLNFKEIRQREDLAPLEPVNKIAYEILSLNKDLMIVGHLPFLAKLANLLLINREEPSLISFKNSGVVVLEYDGREFRLCWFIVPELLGGF